MPSPASHSASGSLQKSSRNTLRGSTAYERESRYNVNYGGEAESSSRPIARGKTEFDILKENHRFIRDDEEQGAVSWEERIARAYESKLFKEYALIDLKHFKQKRFALRWRTAEEVVQGTGEATCSSLRCPYHALTDHDYLEGIEMPPLRAFELPFAYVEAGERKSALVKVKLCGRCERKLLWKPKVKEDGVEESDLQEEGSSSRRARSTSGGHCYPDRRKEGRKASSQQKERGRSERPPRSRDRSRSPEVQRGRRAA